MPVTVCITIANMACGRNKKDTNKLSLSAQSGTSLESYRCVFLYIN